MPSLSIVIPTHERAEILEQCLRRLEGQTMREALEVIVVSDGHDAKTASLFAKGTWRIPLQFLEIEKSHQGVARNRGVERASAPLILFIGDDIFLEPHACQKHLEAHAFTLSPYGGKGPGDRGCLVLGFTTWDPTIGVTPVMEWLERSGWQFGYPHIRKYTSAFLPQGIQERFTYTSHVSLPTDIAKRFPFREDVSLYGWEDVEWGLRLKEAGIRLFYEPSARAFHHHHLTLEDSLRRMETLGESFVHMGTYAPHFRMPAWKRLAYYLAALLPTMAGKHRWAFLRGMKKVKGPP